MIKVAPTTTVNTGGTGYTVSTLVAHLEDSNTTITGGNIDGTVIGITTPGNKTVFLRGKIGTTSGKDSLSNASSSSVVIKGIKSASDSISRSDKLSRLLKKD